MTLLFGAVVSQFQLQVLLQLLIALILFFDEFERYRFKFKDKDNPAPSANSETKKEKGKEKETEKEKDKEQAKEKEKEEKNDVAMEKKDLSHYGLKQILNHIAEQTLDKGDFNFVFFWVLIFITNIVILSVGGENVYTYHCSKECDIDTSETLSVSNSYNYDCGSTYATECWTGDSQQCGFDRNENAVYCIETYSIGWEIAMISLPIIDYILAFLYIRIKFQINLIKTSIFSIFFILATTIVFAFTMVFNALFSIIGPCGVWTDFAEKYKKEQKEKREKAEKEAEKEKQAKEKEKAAIIPIDDEDNGDDKSNQNYATPSGPELIILREWKDYKDVKHNATHIQLVEAIMHNRDWRAGVLWFIMAFVTFFCVIFFGSKIDNQMYQCPDCVSGCDDYLCSYYYNVGSICGYDINSNSIECELNNASILDLYRGIIAFVYCFDYAFVVFLWLYVCRVPFTKACVMAVPCCICMLGASIPFCVIGGICALIQIFICY